MKRFLALLWTVVIVAMTAGTPAFARTSAPGHLRDTPYFGHHTAFGHQYR